MEPYGIIYCYKNKINGKCYIGQTIDPRKRMRVHKLASTELSCSYFHRAIKKYGFDNFEYFVLHSGKTKEELNILEAEEIQNRNTLSPFGYNLKTGGRQRTKLSKSSYDKNRASCIKRWSNPDEHERHIKIMNSPGVKAKISESVKKSKSFQEAIKKYQEARRIRNAPVKAKNDRVREILSFILSAERKRVHSTKEYKDYIRSTKQSGSKKINISACIPVFCITNGRLYLSAGEASRSLGLDQGCISKISRGDGHSTGGYYFRRATEEESARIKAEHSCS